MNRKKSRRVAMELCYSMEISKDEPSLVLENFLDNYEEDKTILDKEYIIKILNAVNENKTSIDSKIEELLKGWKLSRISKVNLSILRLAISEMLYIDDVPKKVAINEALDVAKEYSDEKSVAFINGILDNIYKEEN
ncbi:transcription antitermination factor NusB [Clostridium intestinale]|jgi:N utilization substance protein B|uniref:Transcription antitermination protein NusB n=2 Tax=Clostridium intestinale TaxID=36845 RepID=U2NPU4_9CLOT|nr:transcription antitermination factor NusB [Clostridium intestinale]ERK31193.1 transcription antitermination protein NusB [Clostridium intestinale URNW]QLY78296.1 transcription antitermination factor NusB [Clostridium intestinale]